MRNFIAFCCEWTAVKCAITADNLLTVAHKLRSPRLTNRRPQGVETAVRRDVQKRSK